MLVARCKVAYLISKFCDTASFVVSDIDDLCFYETPRLLMRYLEYSPDITDLSYLLSVVLTVVLSYADEFFMNSVEFYLVLSFKDSVILMPVSILKNERSELTLFSRLLNLGA